MMWSFQSKPPGSNATIIRADHRFAKFIADEPGEYVVEFQIQTPTVLAWFTLTVEVYE